VSISGSDSYVLLFLCNKRIVNAVITMSTTMMMIFVHWSVTDGHIIRHKARVRLFCLAFLSGSPTLEVGVNDRRRRGREVVGRRDIIPIKTEEWIRIEDWRLNGLVDADEFERSKVLRFVPLDACRFELMRFRVRPRPNVELPLQVRVQMSVVDRHIEIRAEVYVHTLQPVRYCIDC